jgi:hypothetical protein
MAPALTIAHNDQLMKVLVVRHSVVVKGFDP